jgi:hypothetical protein
LAKPKQAGKKEGGLGEGIFAHLFAQRSWAKGWDGSEKEKIASAIFNKPSKNLFLFN